LQLRTVSGRYYGLFKVGFGRCYGDQNFIINSQHDDGILKICRTKFPGLESGAQLIIKDQLTVSAGGLYLNGIYGNVRVGWLFK
jgi:hypothetical protein